VVRFDPLLIGNGIPGLTTEQKYVYCSAGYCLWCPARMCPDILMKASKKAKRTLPCPHCKGEDCWDTSSHGWATDPRSIIEVGERILILGSRWICNKCK
jgi:hypothetical protein